MSAKLITKLTDTSKLTRTMFFDAYVIASANEIKDTIGVDTIDPNTRIWHCLYNNIPFTIYDMYHYAEDDNDSVGYHIGTHTLAESIIIANVLSLLGLKTVVEN